MVLLFPGFNLTWLAPVALAPLLIACAREPSWKRRWFYGWAAGAVFWCGVCPWIEFVMDVHGGMGPWGGWGTFILFGLYKGLHMAVFATLAGFLMPRWWAIPSVAALWTGIERTHGFFGFAWLDLGNAGIDMPWPMRLAPITGVYGLSFVFAMLSLRGSVADRPQATARVPVAGGSGGADRAAQRTGSSCWVAESTCWCSPMSIPNCSGPKTTFATRNRSWHRSHAPQAQT